MEGKFIPAPKHHPIKTDWVWKQSTWKWVLIFMFWLLYPMENSPSIRWVRGWMCRRVSLDTVMVIWLVSVLLMGNKCQTLKKVLDAPLGAPPMSLSCGANHFHSGHQYQYPWGGCTRRPMYRDHFLIYCASPSTLFCQ